MTNHDIPDTELLRVVMWDSCNVAQIEKRDAKEHPDCKKLPKLLLNLLEQNWVDSSAEEKSAIGLLWAPCLAALKVEALFALEPLSSFRERVWDAVTLWTSARLVKHGEGLPFPVGEIFVEADGGHLIPVPSQT